MALPLTISDFKLRQTTCELRYPDAFLIFDKTGSIYHQLNKRFTNVRTDSASPAQTQMTADEGIIAVEHQAIRLTDNDPDSKLERFASIFRTLFDIASKSLELVAFTRIGLRQIFNKPFPSIEEATSALNALHAVRVGDEKRFGIGSEISELLLRWEDKQLGTIVRIKAEHGTFDAKFPPELGLQESSVHKEINRLVIDIDYYTIGIVEQEQWDPATWIPQSARIVRREVDKILSI